MELTQDDGVVVSIALIVAFVVLAVVGVTSYHWGFYEGKENVYRLHHSEVPTK